MEKVLAIPKWLQLRYGCLLKELGHKEFKLQDAIEILDDKKEIVAVILSKLRKNGWLNVKFDPIDNRKRIYQLNDAREIMVNIPRGVKHGQDKQSSNYHC